MTPIIAYPLFPRKALQKKSHPFPEQFEMLLGRLKNMSSPLTKIPIPTMEGFRMIPAESIIRCASDGNSQCSSRKMEAKLWLHEI